MTNTHDKLREAVARALFDYDYAWTSRKQKPVLDKWWEQWVNGPWFERADAALSLMQPEIDRRVAEERAKLLEKLRSLSLWLGAGSGSDDAAELEKRIRWGIDHQVSSTVQRCADVVERLSKKPGTRWGEVKAAILELQEAQFEQENEDGN